MVSFADLFTKLVTLSSRVDSVSGKIDTLTRKVEELNERVIRLESAGDLNAEKAKNAAMGAVVASNAGLVEKIAKLEARFGGSPALDHRPRDP